MTASGNHLLFSLTVLLGPADLALLLSGCGNHPVEHRGIPSGAGGIVAHAAAGEAAAVRRSLAAGEQAGARNSHGETSLMAAAMNGLTHVCRLLVRAGAHMDDQSRRGNTALILAARWGHFETVTVL
ncbi:MAG: ankyrin repeat domain-containing protein, partial [SAR324 cluster bacterium]|nr:ankyrin repeat domain-containing protein [SAR324 cluster bacterium]